MAKTRKNNLTESFKKMTNTISRTVKRWTGGFIKPSAKNTKSTPSTSKKTKRGTSKKIISQKSLASYYPSVLNR